MVSRAMLGAWCGNSVPLCVNGNQEHKRGQVNQAALYVIGVLLVRSEEFRRAMWLGFPVSSQSMIERSRSRNRINTGFRLYIAMTKQSDLDGSHYPKE